MSNTLRGGSKVYGVEIDSATRGPKRNSFTLLNFREFSSLFLRERPRKSAMREWVEMNWDKLVLNYSEDSSSSDFERYLGSYVSMDLLAEADRLSREISTKVSPTQYNLRKNLMVQSGGMVRRSVLMRNLYLYLSYLFNRELYVSLMGKYPFSYFDESQFGGENSNIVLGTESSIEESSSNYSNNYNGNNNSSYNNSSYNEYSDNNEKSGNRVNSPNTVVMTPQPTLKMIHQDLLNEKLGDVPHPRGIYLLGFEFDNGIINEIVLKIAGYDAKVSWLEISDAFTSSDSFNAISESLFLTRSHFVYEGFMYKIFSKLVEKDKTVDDHVVHLLLGKEIDVEYPVKEPLKIDTGEVKFSMECDELLNAIVQKTNSNKIFALFTSYKPYMIPLCVYLKTALDYSNKRLSENKGRIQLLERNVKFVVQQVYKQIFTLLSYLFKKYKFIHGDLHGKNLLVKSVDFVILDDDDILSKHGIPYIEFFDFDWSLFWGKTKSVLVGYIYHAESLYSKNLVVDSVNLASVDMGVVMHFHDIGRLLFHSGLHNLIYFLNNETMNIIFGDVPDNWREILINMVKKYKPIMELSQVSAVPYIMVDFAIQVGYLKPQVSQPQVVVQDQVRKRVRNNRGNREKNNNIREPNRKK